MRLELQETHDTGLAYWKRTRFTVLPSGTVVMWGKDSETGYVGLRCFTKSATDWKRSKMVYRFCHHEDSVCAQGVRVEKKERLAVSCRDCRTIKLLDLDTGHYTTSFHTDKYLPGMMCLGEEGQMYVVNAVKGNTLILQLNCSTADFILNKALQSDLETYHSICYVPTHRLTVITDHTAGVVKAVSCDNGEVVWELNGQVAGVQCEPHGMVFAPDYNALFVADGSNKRILVLDPWDGSLRQVLPLDQLGSIWELCLLNNQLVVHHHSQGREEISHLSILPDLPPATAGQHPPHTAAEMQDRDRSKVRSRSTGLVLPVYT